MNNKSLMIDTFNMIFYKIIIKIIATKELNKIYIIKIHKKMQFQKNKILIYRYINLFWNRLMRINNRQQRTNKM